MTVGLLLMTLAIFVFVGWDVDGVRSLIRATARTSLVLFSGAFTASSMARLWKHPASRWMIRNRRYLGVSFGVSHTIHYIAVATYAALDPESFFASEDAIGPEKLVPIVMLALLVATSFDRSAALLGPRLWKWLHWSGSYFFWASFLAAFGGRAPGSVFYSMITLFIVFTFVIRLAAFMVIRSQKKGPTRSQVERLR